MPEVQELFRTATKHVRPMPGALDRQLREQRRRSARRKAGAMSLLALLALVASVIVIRGLAERGGGNVPADTNSKEGRYTVVNDGYGFSNDGSRLFAVGSAGFVYDAATGVRLNTVEGDRGNATIAFSPDGSLVVTVRGGRSPGVLDTYVYETASGRELWDFRKSCCFVAFSPDGRLLALPRDGQTRVVDLATGATVIEFDEFGRFAFSPDGRRLVVSSDDPGVLAKVFDVDGGDHDAALRIPGVNGGDAFATVLAWSPDGSTLVTATDDGDAVIWDVQSGARLFTIRSPAGRFTSLAFDTSGSRLATGSSDGTAIVWDLSSRAARPAFRERVGIDDGWLTVALSPDGSKLMTAAAGTDTTVRDIA